MNSDQLNAGGFEHLGVGHGLVDVLEDPDLAGDRDVAGVVNQLDHLGEQLPFILEE